MISSRCLLTVVALALAASPAMARHRHHHAPITSRTSASPATDWSGWQAETIERATARQRAAPGLTEELAPDAKETATGGPVGGVPGYDGF